MSIMQGADPEAVEILSRDRLEGFRDKDDESDKVLVGRYLLNAAIAEALHPLLHAVEVVLRNRLNEAVSAKYPIEADLPDQYHDYPSWLDATAGPVTESHQKHVVEAKNKVHKELRRQYGPGLASARRMRTPGRLVAALPFSFWVFLFDTDYSGTRDAPGNFWPELLPAVFPHKKPSVPLNVIRSRLRHLLVVRNRVMHHERIHPYSAGKGLPWNPMTIRREILELLGWMSPRAEKLVGRFDRLPEVMDPLNLRYLRWTPWLF
ncbi:hypothetical protein [Longimicrobium sp.]|jgi:hypothetical protein|uniref:hypothetical protein n=1 Tax=Longimicrobium sp. TaxID=2029185 RepID=UPI002ED9FB86